MDGSTLKILRRTCGYPQKYVAKKSGYSFQYISALENGTTPPNETALRKIRQAVFDDIDDTQIAVIVAVYNSVAPRAGDKCSVMQAQTKPSANCN